MEFLIKYWAIFIFIFIQVISVVKILWNMKVSNIGIRNDLKITNTEIIHLKEHVHTQNGRIDKLETRVSKHLENHK